MVQTNKQKFLGKRLNKNNYCDKFVFTWLYILESIQISNCVIQNKYLSTMNFGHTKCWEPAIMSEMFSPKIR